MVEQKLSEGDGSQPPRRMRRLSKLNPDLARVKELVLKSTNSDDFKKMLDATDAPLRGILICALFKEMGRTLYASQNYLDAVHRYRYAALIILGHNDAEGTVPLPSFKDEHMDKYNQICQANDSVAVQSFLQLVSCFNNIALCMLKSGDLVQAIDWLHEIQKLYDMRDSLAATNGYPWLSSMVGVLEYGTYYLKFRLRLAEVLLQLGNTGAAAYLYLSCTIFGDATLHEFDEVRALTASSKQQELTRLRHPNFKTAYKEDVVYPELQLRGVWRRLHVNQAPRPRKRAGLLSWIWKSKLYVFGGTSHSTKSKYFSDTWCLDLKRMDSWRRLPEQPTSFSRPFHTSQHTKMCVWENEAWLFFGDQTLVKLNLLQEKWYSVKTKWESRDPWPYTENMLIEYSAEIFDGKLYIFGGADTFTSPAINLLTVLNLDTLRWSKLGGTATPKLLIKDMPTLRRGAGSWVVPHERRMYILYGCASKSRNMSSSSDEVDEEVTDHQHEDMWSYSFDENKWHRERLRGNFPAPRARMACVYNSTLNHVIVFGGCNIQLLTDDVELTKKTFPWTVFGDTFVLDMGTRVWRQVLARNFPPYRALCAAFFDESTGDTYLYGGSCSSEFLPLKSANEITKSASLGDLWKLELDIPGGSLCESGSESKQLRKFGPWKLCFGCGEYRVDMFACGGSCGGRIFLCSVDCQKKCWKKHEQLHYCGGF